MKTKLLISAIAAAAFGTSAWAAEFADVDADGNQQITLEEIQAMAPEGQEVTQEQFDLYDRDQDGAYNEREFELWNTVNGEDSGAAEEGATEASPE